MDIRAVWAALPLPLPRRRDPAKAERVRQHVRAELRLVAATDDKPKEPTPLRLCG
jgi:hypothetical protein